MSTDLNYDMSTVVGPLDETEVEAFQKWLHESGYTKIIFEQTYLEHIKKFHGAEPKKRYFTTKMGTTHAITRFLNFLPSGSNPQLMSYSVECTWSDIDDRLGDYLMPFAELFAGDYLCFDYQSIPRPRVVVWFHERSEEDDPFTELVANNFDDFLLTLHDKP